MNTACAGRERGCDDNGDGPGQRTRRPAGALTGPTARLKRGTLTVTTSRLKWTRVAGDGCATDPLR